MPAFLDAFLRDWFSVSPSLVIAPSVQHTVLLGIILLVFYSLTARSQLRKILLLLFSFYFYYRLAGSAVLLLLLIGSVDFYSAKRMGSYKERNRLRWYLLPLTVSIGSLVFYKYFNQLLSIYVSVFQVSEPGASFAILAPIGISYYVFKSIGYTSDVYRGVIEQPEQDYISYLLYLSFFPTIVAGPITRSREFLPQLQAPFSLTNQKIVTGFWLILIGIIKKIVLADFLAVSFLDKVYDSPQYFSSTESLITLLATPLYVYYDFSGYTDIALGIALLFGYELKGNFDAPFHSLSLTEFWRKWHITLLDWLNEYIYTPVSFSLRTMGLAGTAIAVVLTFVVSGVWHGATAVFIIWGLLHALWLLLEMLTKPLREPAGSRDRILFRQRMWGVCTLVFVAATFVLFNSSSLDNALVLFSKMLQGLQISTFSKWYSAYTGTCWILTVAVVLQIIPRSFKVSLREKFTGLPWYSQAAFLAVVFYFVYQFHAADAKSFIYLEF